MEPPLTEDARTERRERRLRWIAERCTGRVLDVGCGGSGLGALVTERGLAYVGIDTDPGAVARSRDLVRSDRATFHLLEGKDLDLGRFDTVVMAEVLEHQDAPAELLARYAKLVAGGGRLIATTPFGWMPDPDHRWAPFATHHIEWLAACGLHAREIEIGDYHVRCVATRDPSSAVGWKDLLRATEIETERVQRFWIGERDREHARVETLIARTEELAARIDRLKARIEEQGGSLPRRIVRRVRRLLVR
jgi:SAM-dependent methyltransferase